MATPELFALMKQRGIILCPTLSAGVALSGPDSEDNIKMRETFKNALKSGVTIANGSDVGVFAHGDNAGELVLMVKWGMQNADALRSATSINARLLQENKIGQVKTGLLADLIAVKGNPMQDISALRKVMFVMQNGVVYKQ
jgi:imidazolonepropionase-like amidohydrolase